MGTPQFRQGKPLVRGGKPSMHPRCCCITEPCDLCSVDHFVLSFEGVELCKAGCCRKTTWPRPPASYRFSAESDINADWDVQVLGHPLCYCDGEWRSGLTLEVREGDDCTGELLGTVDEFQIWMEFLIGAGEAPGDGGVSLEINQNGAEGCMPALIFYGLRETVVDPCRPFTLSNRLAQYCDCLELECPPPAQYPVATWSLRMVVGKGGQVLVTPVLV